ncbi:endonuclease/exonuclease/phosphatase family protein [Streptomyces sp. NPDC053755]|uniref:endonuclease/exonuclease/phosphatase family protein n=1 Tax=Streptomyces sp. NPDC053755 TaxID=3155815 RepID=UPI003438C148
MKRRLRRLTVVLSLFGLLLTGAAPASAASTTATYTVWHWNVSGNVMWDGQTAGGMVTKAVSSISNRDADLVSFNEICFGQYKAIQQGLVAAGWPEDTGNFSRFAETLAPRAGLCDGQSGFGNALFSKEALGSSRQYPLPADTPTAAKPTPEPRKMLCAPLAAQALMKFCTVHITTSNVVGAGETRADNVRQLDEVRSVLDGFDAAGETYLIAGDFNAQPSYGRLNAYYAPSVSTDNNADNTGAHRELDDADPANCPGYGEWTADAVPGTAPPCGGKAKIDHVFVRESRVAGAYSADSLAIATGCTVPDPMDPPADPTQCSDHRIVVGTVPVLIG